MSVRSRLGAPLRRYFDPQFAQINHRLDELVPTAAAAPTINRARALARVDVSRHNTGGDPPTFDEVVSQVVSAAQFADPNFVRLREVMFPGTVTIPWGTTQASVTVPHRKLWEFCYILRAAEQHGKLEPGSRAVGFGVGQEPIPAALARVRSVGSRDRPRRRHGRVRGMGGRGAAHDRPRCALTAGGRFGRVCWSAMCARGTST